MPPGGFEIESELEIGRPPAEVFAFLVDTRRARDVDAALVEVDPEGPLRAGLTGRMVHRRSVMVARTTWRVVEFEPPRRLVMEILGMGDAMTEAASRSLSVR